MRGDSSGPALPAASGATGGARDGGGPALPVASGTTGVPAREAAGGACNGGEGGVPALPAAGGARDDPVWEEGGRRRPRRRRGRRPRAPGGWRCPRRPHALELDVTVAGKAKGWPNAQGTEAMPGLSATRMLLALQLGEMEPEQRCTARQGSAGPPILDREEVVCDRHVCALPLCA
ncbi:hypothetical protein U9M48_036980 [Paspalum notatum var. saurae]|uniref:Uncharacterized protein n=1 Tax=Paspalum notatum var. saurae TaxID=547442 RepID=A0AAQ3XA38_PASNO